MTIKDAILKSLEDLKTGANHTQVYDHIVHHSYYEFATAKTPKATVSALLGDFIRKNDSRVKRLKGKGGAYFYYLSKYDQDVEVAEPSSGGEKLETTDKKYHERDLHKLLSTYLNSQNMHAKTIFHEKSKNSIDHHQKWIHPDMIGINFLNLISKPNQALMKVLKKEDTFKLSSYEIKKDIKTDYDLKKSYFQAVSNSSWANYGYLVAFDISASLTDEIERLSQSFGIGVIELKANPYESQLLFPAKYNELDFKTIDKLCNVNPSFEGFIELTEKILTAAERYVKPMQKELVSFCDSFFIHDSDIERYCLKYNIPMS